MKILDVATFVAALVGGVLALILSASAMSAEPGMQAQRQLQSDAALAPAPAADRGIVGP